MDDDETVQVEVLFGPLAGSILTMSAADAATAAREKWAIPPRTPPIDPNAAPLPDLTPEEREAAEASAAQWAAVQRGEADPPPETEPPDDDDETGRRRTMTAGRHGSYATRRK